MQAEKLWPKLRLEQHEAGSKNTPDVWPWLVVVMMDVLGYTDSLALFGCLVNRSS